MRRSQESDSGSEVRSVSSTCRKQELRQVLNELKESGAKSHASHPVVDMRESP